MSLLASGGAAGAGVIFYQTVWKERRRRRLEREHFRSKVR